MCLAEKYGLAAIEDACQYHGATYKGEKVGFAQLKKFYIQSQTNAKFLSENLKGVVMLFVREGQTHVFHQYTIRFPDGKHDALRTYRQGQRVGCKVYYPVPIHKQTFYVNQLGYKVSLPETEKVATEVLSLPVHAGISVSDFETIVTSMNEFIG